MKQLILAVLERLLTAGALAVRARQTGPVIGVVGSVGKTGTKDALGLIVRQAYGPGAFVTAKSLNAELGVPLTLLGATDLPHGVSWLTAVLRAGLTALFGQAPPAMVVEIGEEKPGDLARFARIVRPTIVVITAVSEAHSAILGPVASLKRELRAVVGDSRVVANADDGALDWLGLPPGRLTTVSLHRRADYFATSIRVDEDGTTAIIHHANRTQKVTIKRWGAHTIYSVLLAAAVADMLGLTPAHQRQTFKSLRAAPGRGAMIEGKKGSRILDDSYNAQPAAMVAAIRTLAALPAKTKVAILGDMRELADPESVHRAIGRLAHAAADYVIGVGPLARHYRPDAWFATAEEAAQSALSRLAPGVMVLVKGSQDTIRLERAVKILMAHPEKAAEKLVRQDTAWLKAP